MLLLLSEMGRAFLRAFGGSLIILLPGVLTAPSLNGAVALGIAALVASLAAGLKAIQVFIPQLSFTSLLPASVRAYGWVLDDFARAFFASFVIAITGWLAMPDFSWSNSIFIGLLVAAVTAGIRAIQGGLTPGDVPAPQSGLHVDRSA